MGWWSTTILGGDAPADAVYDVVEAFGGYESNWDSWDAEPAVLKAHLEDTSVEKLRAFIADAYEPGIAAQAVAVVHMAVGARLDPSLRELTISACRDEDTGGWSNPASRRHCLDEFARRVRDYDDSTPQRPPEKGLWEAVGEHMKSGARGLLNDNC